jgi:hypothetical protein
LPFSVSELPGRHFPPLPQLRTAKGLPTLGFANPAIYQIAQGPAYDIDFHDVADGSTNLYFPTCAGYDNATGWGSFDGANLLLDLAAITEVGVKLSHWAAASSEPAAHFLFQPLRGRINARSILTANTIQFIRKRTSHNHRWLMGARASRAHFLAIHTVLRAGRARSQGYFRHRPMSTYL